MREISAQYVNSQVLTDLELSLELEERRSVSQNKTSKNKVSVPRIPTINDNYESALISGHPRGHLKSKSQIKGDPNASRPSFLVRGFSRAGGNRNMRPPKSSRSISAHKENPIKTQPQTARGQLNCHDDVHIRLETEPIRIASLLEERRLNTIENEMQNETFSQDLSSPTFSRNALDIASRPKVGFPKSRPSSEFRKTSRIGTASKLVLPSENGNHGAKAPLFRNRNTVISSHGQRSRTPVAENVGICILPLQGVYEESRSNKIKSGLETERTPQTQRTPQIQRTLFKNELLSNDLTPKVECRNRFSPARQKTETTFAKIDELFKVDSGVKAAGELRRQLFSKQEERKAKLNNPSNQTSSDWNIQLDGLSLKPRTCKINVDPRATYMWNGEVKVKCQEEAKVETIEDLRFLPSEEPRDALNDSKHTRSSSSIAFVRYTYDKYLPQVE